MDNLYSQVSRRRRRGQGGFTLIELLVVIAVLAILATIVIFNVVGVANRGTSSACATDAKSVQTASDAYYNDGHAGGADVYPQAGGDVKATTPATAVNVGALVSAYLHTAPGNGETFAYTDTSGTVQGSYVGGTC